MAIVEQSRTVRELMTRWVHVVNADTPLPTVARVLSENGVTAVPVLKSGVPIGMVGRTGVLAAMAREEPEAATAADALEPLPPQVQLNTGVYEAAALLRATHGRHLLVLDERGRLAGILSKGDVMRALVVQET